MLRFKNKGGPHSETLPNGNKKVYNKNEEFDSPHDLVALFGSEKFEKVVGKAPVAVEVQDDLDVDLANRGEEVTDQFDGASDADVRVFKNGKYYSVFNSGDLTSPLNEGDLTRKADVVVYIDDLK